MADSTDRNQGRAHRRYLGHRRRRAHDAAAADADAFEPTAVPDHPLIPGDPAHLVDTQAELDQVLARLADAGSFAYDTEFIGETTYRPRLCLIQVATPGFVSIIDPMASPEGQRLDVEGVWQLIADRQTEKLVHAGDVDLEPVVRHIDRGPANIFDTQIAAGFVGFDYPVSLNRLIEDLAGVKLPKGMTFTQWDHRPLSRVHVHYAADDVRYLPVIHDALVERLEQRGRLDWAQQEFAALEDADAYRFDPDAIVKRLCKSGSAPPRVRMLLRRLVVFRDRLAQRRDLPPRSVLRDRPLMDLAREAPSTLRQMRKVENLPRPFVAQHGDTVIHTVERLQETQAWQKPPRRLKPLTPAQRRHVDELWAQVKQLAEDEQIALGLLTSRHGFSALAKRLIRGKTPKADEPLINGWRRDLMQPILNQIA